MTIVIGITKLTIGQNMINWLRNKLQSFLSPVEPDHYGNNEIASTRPHRSGGQLLNSENEPLRFTVYSASGGKIVEISHYDKKQDRNHSSLHIITNDEDFGEELGKIAFIELIKKG